MPKTYLFWCYVPILCTFSLILYLHTYIKVQAELPEPTASDIQNADILQLSSSWNGTDILANATSSVPLAKTGTFNWHITYNPTDPQLVNYLPTLANATYTIQLFKGEPGNSILVESQTVPGLATATSGTFTLAFPGSGHYFLAYTATYPDGENPIGTKCGGDFCWMQKYSLDDYQRFMTRGEFENSSDYGNPVPALYGFEAFDIAEPSGPKDSNILFLPGTMESRLYMRDGRGNEKEVWEPRYNADVLALAINEDGTSKNVVYTRDVADYLYSNIPILGTLVATLAKNSAALYGPFESFLDSLVNKQTIAKWQAYPYDWRYDVNEIVQNGTLVATATSTPDRIYLQDVVRSLASTSPTGKVTIIAHSNGGLLAKALAVSLEREGAISLIDRIILVGTPQAGTPSAIGNILHGDEQTRALGLITKGSTVREIAKEMSGPYDLLPDAAYFSYTETPVAVFDQGTLTDTYRRAYTDSINSEKSFSDFLTDSAKLREHMDSNDLRTPAVLSKDLLTKASDTHVLIDPWVPPNYGQLVSIVGMGQPTISGYTYSGTNKLRHVPNITSQGDDTVDSITAGANPGGGFYFDTQAYRAESGINVVHGSLLNSAPIQKQIIDLLNNDSRVEQYFSTTTPHYNIVPDDVVSAHSPVALLATDASGNQTGMVPIPGTDYFMQKEDIPGSSVQIVDDEKYVYLPAGSYTFSFTGYDVGTTTIEVGKTNEVGSIVTTEYFRDIPTTASTTGSFTLANSMVSSIAVDEDGDGTTNIFIASSTSDESPPTNVTLLPEAHVGGSSSVAGSHASSIAYILLLQLKVQLLELELKVMQLLHIKINFAV